jgi:hypothetical protein
MSGGRKLFEEIVEHSGLASWIGPGTVMRALKSIGVASPDVSQADDYRRALPQLKARMASYLPAHELDSRVQKIEALLKS